MFYGRMIFTVAFAFGIFSCSASEPRKVGNEIGKIEKLTRDFHKGKSEDALTRLFSPSAELHEMIKHLSSKSVDLAETELLPKMIKRQLVGGLKLWGSPTGHFGHTGGLIVRVREHPKKGEKFTDLNLLLPNVHHESLVTQVIGNHVVVRGNLDFNGHHSAFQRAFSLPPDVPATKVQAIYHPVKERLIIRLPGHVLASSLPAKQADSGLSQWEDFLRKVTNTLDKPAIGADLLAQSARSRQVGRLRGGIAPGLAGLLGPALAELVGETFEAMFDDVKPANAGTDKDTQPAVKVPSSLSLKEFDEGRPPAYGSPHYWRIVEDESENRRPTRIDVKLRYPEHMKRAGLNVSVKGQGNRIELLKHIKAKPPQDNGKAVQSPSENFALPIAHIHVPFKLEPAQAPLHSRAEGHEHVVSSFAVPKAAQVHHVPITAWKDEL